ncbi:sugar ABC transporter permease [Candidatus Thioglobus sp.]|jgi:sorbitol/mannitol transport system permease protein|uniref:carbohydrate ABC transporter permease n=1 Tax=Candidatus Pseudothioglobus sp. Uisw_050_01 TaxID=3230997 RepID=UPI00199683CA|nr:sugar ABC transporter permease [SAR86 cluster bacterium]MBT5411650.1 sugar ABC transporter permease [Nitrosomonadales bacterium]MDB4057605.1 sugar ABC transporter permease [Candidatus Thioglobus sp.]MDB4098851.1 sugar ABC transporter permease [Candidatus Thioglobus sp.]MDB9934033.1 sugar ABC transporter permease [Candidatus Thioglobus sp.]|tara:strand:- start:2863 stop:3723 length:861 start_codon:yes stop_codon:yes gene_type:complete
MKFSVSKALQAPSVILLLLWMIVPLSMTIYFSFMRYNLLYPERYGFNGLSNYDFFLTDPALFSAVTNSITLVGSIIAISVILGLGIALLLQETFKGRGIVRVLLISPFFIMPTVNALIWKNMFMNPVYGLFAFVSGIFGWPVVDFLSDFPLLSIIIMLSWQWTPFALLIFMTSLQSMDTEQVEAAELEGAGFWSKFRYLTLPHLGRAIGVVVMIQAIFHLSIFAEIFVTTGGGPGYDSTNTTFLIFTQALLQFDVGVASAGGVFAIVVANIIAYFLIKTVAKGMAK